MERCCSKKTKTHYVPPQINTDQSLTSSLKNTAGLLCLLFVFHENNSAEKVVHLRWCGEAIKNPMINDFKWDCSYQKNPPRTDLLP